MALRRVFAQDADFKESMFARQIAVMKGQAWNVVETLKQPDHGPLELTRRTRVCVWDDVVDVPVAIPMRVPSIEIQRKTIPRPAEEEEMDIGAAYASVPIPSKPSVDLLGSPTSELPNPNRFELISGDELHSADPDRIGENGDIAGPATPTPSNRVEFDEAKMARDNLSSSMKLPDRPKHKARFSFEFPRSTPPRHAKRQRSFSTRSGHRPNVLYDGDDLEGDLGYAVANDMEGNQRKVIVERLEAVKSKNPVFTWC
jgi:phosphatidylinositol 4-kinase type 2